MKIVGFNGSPRKRGNTYTLMSEILRGAKEEGSDTQYIQLQSYHIEGCIGCEKCRTDKICTQFFDGMHLLYPLLEEADGIILGSPTYNYSMTPWMKCFIDRFYPFLDFTEQRPGPYSSRLGNRGKRALIFGVSEQVDPSEMHHNVDAMKDAIKAIGYEIEDTLYFSNHFKASSVFQSISSQVKAYEAGRLFVKSLKK